MKRPALVDLAGTRSGRVVLLANGETLNHHDLSRIDYPLMTMNRSWSATDEFDVVPQYHVVAEPVHYQRHPKVYEEMASRIPVFCCGRGWGDILEKGYAVNVRSHKIRGRMIFSPDCSRGIGLGRLHIGTVMYAALQLAPWLGFRRLDILGLDLYGQHFHKDWPTDEDRLLQQRELFDFAARHLTEWGVEVYNVGSPESRCESFPKLAFDEAYPA